MSLRPSLKYAVFTLMVVLPAMLMAGNPADDLRRADDYRKSLLSSPSRRRYRSNWEKGITMYRKIARDYPTSSVGAKALYQAGNMSQNLHRFSGKKNDLRTAGELYLKVADGYPSSSFADDSLYQSALIDKTLNDLESAYHLLERLVASYPKSRLVPLARKEMRAIVDDPKWLAAVTPTPKPEPTPSSPSPSSSSPVIVQGIRHWSNPDYTRVVIDVDGTTKSSHFTLKADPAADRPPRIVIDIPGAKLPEKQMDPITVGDNLLRQVRCAQNTVDQVRVVLDLASVKSYNTFSLVNPDRIVVDVFGTQTVTKTSPPPPVSSAWPTTTTSTTSSTSTSSSASSSSQSSADREAMNLAYQLGLNVSRVVIDPGHGGKDPGAIGPNGLKEKTAVLDIALKLKRILEKKLGLEVILTRETDVFVPLEERTAIANAKRADLFISIHANASRRRQASGVETYFLNLASSRGAAETAARENMTSVARIGDLEKIITDLLLTTKISESAQLARVLHSSVIEELRNSFRAINDLGVKQAPFYVLIGATMPSILAEVSFISNRSEEKRLADPNYRQKLADAIAEGIGRYLIASEKG